MDRNDGALLERVRDALEAGSSLETVSKSPQIGSVFRITSHHP